MKKQIISILILLFVTHSAFAAAKEIQACNSKQMQSLNAAIVDQKNDGLSNVKLMKNANNEIVGFYAWEKAGEEAMYAEICESVDSDDLTIASEWFYWDGNADPASFRKNETYQMTQDEGIARLKVLEASKSGDITAELSVIGWDSAGKDIVVRTSVLTFVDLK